MQLKLVTIARRSLTGVWLLVVAALLGIGALTHLATTFVIRGGSMEPAIRLGSLIVDEVVPSEEIHIGDVVTIRSGNGVVVTHRVNRVVELDEARYFEVKGDANRAADPVLVPSGALVGRVSLTVPFAGYPAAMMGTPFGLISLLGLVAVGLLMIVLAEGLEEELAEGELPAGAAGHEGSPRGALA